MGRALKFKTPADLGKKVDAYFEKMDKEKRPYLITGLALELGTNRMTLMEYEGEISGREKGKTEEIQENYAYIIKKAKAKCENWLFENALMGKVNATLAIFGLKANHKWRDGDRDTPPPIDNLKKIDPETSRKIKDTINLNR